MARSMCPASPPATNFPAAKTTPLSVCDVPEVALTGAPMGIGALLKAASLVASTSEGLRMVDQGGVRIDGTVISDKGLKVEAGTFVLQVGKRKFARVTLG